MIKTKIIILGCCLLGWGHSDACAQSNAVAAGGDHTGAGGTVSYSLGQIAYASFSGNTGTAAQGLQQPYRITVQSVADYNRSLPEITAFPNPAGDMVWLQTGPGDHAALQYLLYDVQGKALASAFIEPGITQVPLGTLPNAVYFLKVFNTHQTKIFKITKNK